MMKNYKKWTIPEGKVKNVKDSQGRIIWSGEVVPPQPDRLRGKWKPKKQQQFDMSMFMFDDNILPLSLYFENNFNYYGRDKETSTSIILYDDCNEIDIDNHMEYEIKINNDLSDRIIYKRQLDWMTIRIMVGTSTDFVQLNIINDDLTPYIEIFDNYNVFIANNDYYGDYGQLFMQFLETNFIKVEE